MRRTRFLRQRHLLVLLALLALVALVAAACGSGSTATEAGGGGGTEAAGGSEAAAAAGDASTLVVGSIEVPGHLDLARVYELFASNILFNTTNRLVEFQPGTGEIGPGLAEDWEISDDGLTYTFNLRDGVKFQDGSDMTSEDVKWSLERSLNIAPGWRGVPDRGHRVDRGPRRHDGRDHPVERELHVPVAAQLHRRIDPAQRQRRLPGSRRAARRALAGGG